MLLETCHPNTQEPLTPSGDGCLVAEGPPSVQQFGRNVNVRAKPPPSPDWHARPLSPAATMVDTDKAERARKARRARIAAVQKQQELEQALDAAKRQTLVATAESRQAANDALAHMETRFASGDCTIPDSHTTHETPCGMMGRINSSEQQLGRAVIRRTGADLTAGDGDAAQHENTTDVHDVRTQNTVGASTLLQYGTAQLLAIPDVPALPPARILISAAMSTESPRRASTTQSWPARVSSEQERPPSRTNSQSSLVNVKEGLYAIRPSVYEAVGEPQPMHTGSSGTAAAAEARSTTRHAPVNHHGVANTASDQHAHVECGHGTAKGNHDGRQHSTENVDTSVGQDASSGISSYGTRDHVDMAEPVTPTEEHHSQPPCTRGIW